MYDGKFQNSPEHWLQTNWHEKHMSFHTVRTSVSWNNENVYEFCQGGNELFTTGMFIDKLISAFVLAYLYTWFPRIFKSIYINKFFLISIARNNHIVSLSVRR